MFQKIKLEIAVGLIFFISMAFLGYYTIIMSRKIFDPGETYLLKAKFANTEGLRKTDKVSVNGVMAGSVEDIVLKPDKVLVSMRMHQKFDLYDNYKIQIQSESVMAGKKITIYPGSPIDKKGGPHELLSIEEQLQGDLADPIRSVTTLIEENRENIHQTIKNIREITEKINSGNGTIGKLINEDSVHSQANDLLKDMDEAIEDSREQAPITSFLKAAMTVF